MLTIQGAGFDAYEYSVSESGTSFELVDSHYAYSDTAQILDSESNQTVDCSIISYDGIIGGVDESGDTYPEWWSKIFADYHFISMPFSEYQWLKEKILYDYAGSYEDYVAENTPDMDELKSKYSYEVYTSAKTGMQFTLTLDEFIEKELALNNRNSWFVVTSESIGYEEYLVAEHEWESFPSISEIDFSNSWVDFE